MVIVLSVTGQVSGQGIEEFFSLCFGYSISSSTIDNIRKEYNELAAEFLAGVGLSKIKVGGACDEIYSNNTPYFTGIDLKTLYIFICEKAPDASGDSWNKSISRLHQNQNLNMTTCITDRGKGLLNGIKAALPDVRQQLDIFHVMRDLGNACSSLLCACENFVGVLLVTEEAV